MRGVKKALVRFWRLCRVFAAVYRLARHVLFDIL